MLAVAVLPVAAGVALAADDTGFHGHALTEVSLGDLAADGNHITGKLMDILFLMTCSIR